MYLNVYFSNHQGQEGWTRPLLLRILWSPSYHVVLNSKCRELLDLMTEALICLRTSVNKRQKEELVRINKKILICDLLNLFKNCYLKGQYFLGSYLIESP